MPHIKPKSLNPQHGTGYHASFLGIAGEALTANDIVIANGYSGDRIKFVKADANAAGLSDGVMGVVDHTTANGASVRVVSHKLVTSVDSSAAVGVGYPVYLSDTAGGWSTAEGSAGVVIGSVVADHASTGAVLLSPAHSASPTGRAGAVKGTATDSLTAAQNGRTIIVGPLAAGLAGDSIFSLPAAANGLHFRFTYVGGAADAEDFQIRTGSDTNFLIGGVAHFDTDSDDTDGIPDVVYSNNSSNSRVNFLTPQAGTWAEVYCDGTNWFLNGQCVSATNAAVTFANE